MSTAASKDIFVDFLGQTRPVRVMGEFDAFLDQFSAEIHGNLTDDRCPFGVLLWPSSRVLARELALNLPPFLSQRAPRRILELGCGVGYLSCALALLFPEAEIIAADFESGLEPYVLHNAKTWGVEQGLYFQTIDWRQPVPEVLAGGFDWVLGADVFYDDSHLKQLPPFAHGLLREGGFFTLADPKRFRFGAALARIKEYFDLVSWQEYEQNLAEDGIEDFMMNRGLEWQKVSLLHFAKAPLPSLHH